MWLSFRGPDGSARTVEATGERFVIGREKSKPIRARRRRPHAGTRPSSRLGRPRRTDRPNRRTARSSTEPRSTFAQLAGGERSDRPDHPDGVSGGAPGRRRGSAGPRSPSQQLRGKRRRSPPPNEPFPVFRRRLLPDRAPQAEHRCGGRRSRLLRRPRRRRHHAGVLVHGVLGSDDKRPPPTWWKLRRPPRFSCGCPGRPDHGAGTGWVYEPSRASWSRTLTCQEGIRSSRSHRLRGRARRRDRGVRRCATPLLQSRIRRGSRSCIPLASQQDFARARRSSRSATWPSAAGAELGGAPRPRESCPSSRRRRTQTRTSASPT